MGAILDSLMTGLPFLLLHSSVTFLMLAAALAIYMWITPYDELLLIKSGNTAAAITLGGAVVGFAIPLAVTLKTSLNLWDIVIWGVVTLVLMIIAYRVMDFVVRDFQRRVESDEIGPAILLASVKIAVGLITAASVAG
jgi:putative membrane protein